MTQSLKYTLLLTLVSLFTNCESRIKQQPFEKELWNKQSDLGFEYREQMLDDLVSNYLRPDVTKADVIELLGEPNNNDTNVKAGEHGYFLNEEYDWDIDPTTMKYLILIFDGSTILNKVYKRTWEAGKGTRNEILASYKSKVRDTLRIRHHYYYLADKELRVVAEQFMNNELRPSDNFITFRVLDSLTSTNAEVREFYLPVFNKILRQSDGALSEVIGTPILKYLKMYPNEFISTTESDELFELYSNYAAYVLYFSNDYKSDIAELERTAISNCQPCQNPEHIKNFLKLTAKKVEEI